MVYKTFPWSAARTLLRRIHGIDDGRESREGVAVGWAKVWFCCKCLEGTQSALEERLDLEINFLAARYFGHKRQNTSRPGQQVHADDLCIGVSFFECEGAESLTSAHIQDPKRASRTGAQLADARAKRELVLTEIGQLHLCELLKTPGKK